MLIPDSKVIMINNHSSQLDFNDFIGFIRQDNLPDAAVVLTHLFGLPLANCLKCASYFEERYDENPGLILQKVVQIKKELRSGSFNDAQLLIYGCFGIQGLDAIGALEMIRRGPSLFP